MRIVRADPGRAEAMNELLTQLEAITLYARGFAHALCDTTFKADADALHAAAERAFVAARKLAHWQRPDVH